MSHPTFTLNKLYQPIQHDLLAVEQVFDQELNTDLPFVADLCETIRSYRGKMLRPALTLLVGRAVGELTPAHHTIAAVLEMVHMATLVHDDVLDEATQRRDQPTVSSVSGNVAAVLTGDFLISHAFHLCSSLDSQFASRQIGATTNTVCEGELLQNEMAGDATSSEEVYFDIVRRKTGSLVSTASELGAHFAGADPELCESMRSMGMSAGVAFQIVDDILDIVGDANEMGKTLDRDLSLGKLTLPTIHCLANANEQVAAHLRKAVIEKRPYRPEQLRNWLDSTGSIDYALSTARGFVLEAMKKLDLLPPSEAKQSLTSLIEFILQRQS